ncbi:S8 family serine peptidase [Terrabacter terrigena]|uniref:S8 family serine peptidase n=1 Tax=Terrabacter terrigena TaxID=574718 RepID=A0ABW3MZM9_9MICO
MGLLRRRSVMSAVVALGLVVPPAAAAFAAGDGNPPTTKREQLSQLHPDAAKAPSPGTKGSAGRVGALAVQRGSGKVVLSVKVRKGAQVASSLADVARSAKAHGGAQRRVLRQLDTVSVEVPATAATGFAAALRGRADVTRVDVVGRKTFSFLPNDPDYPATASYLGAVGAPAAWDVQRGDAAVHIAVVDSGVDVAHPDLAGRVTDTYNAVDGSTDVTDDVGHGTFVAGVAAATADNGIGIAGASVGASVMAVKVADPAGQVFADKEAAGIIWAADHGADVINLSLGSAAADQVESDAVAYAVGKGVLVVAAAGNDGSTNPSYPAAYPKVVAVGATDAAGNRAPFSQHGTWVTVAAPGTSIRSTSPTAGSTFFPAGGYATGDGTSFSTPLVAAEAALLWSQRRSVSADDVRAAIVGSAHGYAGLGLGAGQVDYRAAFDTLRPDTVPTLTAPADGASVSGPVSLTAASGAAKVRFSVDGSPLGAPVATSGGSATTVWSTWGLPNGAHTISAADCSTKGLCNPALTQASVTLANAAPVITSPKPSQTLSGSATFTATAAGGAVAFVIDGVRRGLDTSAPFALTYPVSALSDGTHSVQAVSCSTTGACSGPTSAAVSFSNQSLHPRFTAVSPGVFSPNSDGRSDSTKVTYSLPDTETVTFVVRNAAGAVVRGPLALGTLTAGSHSVVWNGLLNGGARATSGTYRLELATTRPITGGSLRGSAITYARVDMAPPTMSSVTGSGSGFYPYPDTYRDTFSPALTLNEPAVVTLTVRSSAGAVVRSIAATRAVGRTTMTWNGRNTAGALVGAGTYSWSLTAQDGAGNRRTSAKYSVTVSSKRLVTKTATVTKNGNTLSSGGGSAYCADVDTGLSDFASGVWLSNICDRGFDGFQIAAATYRFTAPAAISYSSLKIEGYGFSLATSRLGAGFTRWGTVDYTFTPEVLTGTSPGWRTIGSVSPAALVNETRLVEATVYVPNAYAQNDYDMGQVRLTVTYKVLA